MRISCHRRAIPPATAADGNDCLSLVDAHCGSRGQRLGRAVPRAAELVRSATDATAMHTARRVQSAIAAIGHVDVAADGAEFERLGSRTDMSPGTFGVGQDTTFLHYDRLIELIQLDAVDETHAAVADMQIGEPGVLEGVPAPVVQPRNIWLTTVAVRGSWPETTAEDGGMKAPNSAVPKPSPNCAIESATEWVTRSATFVVVNEQLVGCTGIPATEFFSAGFQPF